VGVQYNDTRENIVLERVAKQRETIRYDVEYREIASGRLFELYLVVLLGAVLDRLWKAPKLRAWVYSIETRIIQSAKVLLIFAYIKCYMVHAYIYAAFPRMSEQIHS